MAHPTSLVCSRCEQIYSANCKLNLCDCGAPLLVRYDLARVRRSWNKQDLAHAPHTMWRYDAVLPANTEEAVTLGEGMTRLRSAPRLGALLGGQEVRIKDEGENPTASFMARDVSMAVTMAKKLGFKKLALSSSGNAASALAAYAAAAGLETYIFMPSDVSQANFIECKGFGAYVTLVDGLLGDCASFVAERAPSEGWFDVTTLKEPYGIEGKKTIGYEIAEQYDWQLPDAILCPCGGGAGLIGIWKAFAELVELGWLAGQLPKMIAVQAAGCAPIVRAFEQGAVKSEPWPGARTIASGLRVPRAIGDALVLEAIRGSRGTAVAISDEEILDGGLDLARSEGLFAAPETGACVAALRKLISRGFLRSEERVLLLSTASGLKYLEIYSTRFERRSASEQDKLGGLITPR